MKKIISVLLSLCVLCSAIPMYVFAENHSLELVFENDYITTYGYSDDVYEIYLQNLDASTIQATILSGNDTRILNIHDSDLARSFVYSEDSLWESALDYTLSHLEDSSSIESFVSEVVAPSLYSTNRVGSEDIIEQMIGLYGQEYTDRVVYTANDRYNSQVLEDLEYLVRSPDSYAIDKTISITSFIVTFLNIALDNPVFSAICDTISLITGGASIFEGETVLVYRAIAQYYQYGYCMGAPQVYYSAEKAHDAFALKDQNGVVTGSFELCPDPMYVAAQFPFDSYGDIVSSTISAYLY